MTMMHTKNEERDSAGQKTEALGTIIKVVLSNSLLLTQVVCAKEPITQNNHIFSSLFISPSLFLSLSLRES